MTGSNQHSTHLATLVRNPHFTRDLSRDEVRQLADQVVSLVEQLQPLEREADIQNDEAERLHEQLETAREALAWIAQWAEQDVVKMHAQRALGEIQRGSAGLSGSEVRGWTPAPAEGSNPAKEPFDPGSFDEAVRGAQKRLRGLASGMPEVALIKSLDAPWEYVQDEREVRETTARVLDSHNRLVFEGHPHAVAAVVDAINTCAAYYQSGGES